MPTSREPSCSTGTCVTLEKLIIAPELLCKFMIGRMAGGGEESLSHEETQGAGDWEAWPCLWVRVPEAGRSIVDMPESEKEGRVGRGVGTGAGE